MSSAVNKDQLAEVVSELIQRVASVADVADQLWQGKGMGKDIRSCGEIIQQNVTQIMKTEAESKPKLSLYELAEQNCRHTFNQLELMEPNAGSDLRLYEIMAVHARELFEALQISKPAEVEYDDDDEAII
jgi:hypothetical protein